MNTQNSPDAPHGAIPSVQFTTFDLPPAQQFEAYRADAISFAELLARDPSQGCQATYEAWSLGAVVLKRTSSPALDQRRTAAMAKRDGLDHWLINLPTRSSQRLTLGVSEIEVSAARPILMHCSAPFAVERPVAEEDWLMAFVARDALPGLGLPAGLDGIAALATPIGQLLVALIREAGARLPEMTISDAAGVRDAITALLRATLSPSSDNLAAAQPQAAAMMRQRIRAVIRAQMGLATLTPERLCRETGLSRTSLYRLFEPLGGVAAAIDAERLAYARRRIEDLAERRTIAQIAEEVGYFDPSAFSRAFRRRYGTTATEVRETARAGQPPVATISKVSGRSFLDLVARAEW